MQRAPSVFLLYRDSPLRRAALAAPVGDASRYALYGLDELAASGLDVSHNLAREAGSAAHAAASVLDRAVRLGGGYSGDFASVLASRRELNDSHAVFSTVDTVGIPLVLLARAGRVRPPIVYAAIGLPERLERLRTRTARRVFRDAYRRTFAIVAYAESEADELRDWVGDGGPPVRFVPFGVDPESFAPAVRERDYDVVSVGADPRRDLELLLGVARRLPGLRFLVVASADGARALRDVPANVDLETDIPFAEVRDRLLRGRLVALPVRENSYSGATTTLLQALACARPVVVTRTAAIARGYHLEDRANCRLVAPGDADAFGDAVASTLADEDRAEALGRRGRETVLEHLTWERYAAAMRGIVVAAVERTTVPA